MIQETLLYSDYKIEEKQSSRIDPDKEIRVTVGFRCPRCKKQHDNLGHGETVQCKCGLWMERLGNGLKCELDI